MSDMSCDACPIPELSNAADNVCRNARKNGDAARKILEALNLVHEVSVSIKACEKPRVFEFTGSIAVSCGRSDGFVNETVGEWLLDLQDQDTFSTQVSDALLNLAYGQTETSRSSE